MSNTIKYYYILILERGILPNEIGAKDLFWSGER